MKIWTQLVIKVAREQYKKKHCCCTNLCALIKGFRPEVFYYLSEKLFLSQKLYFLKRCNLGKTVHNLISFPRKLHLKCKILHLRVAVIVILLWRILKCVSFKNKKLWVVKLCCAVSVQSCRFFKEFEHCEKAFVDKHKISNTKSVSLSDYSVSIVMGGMSQSRWQSCLLKSYIKINTCPSIWTQTYFIHHLGVPVTL